MTEQVLGILQLPDQTQLDQLLRFQQSPRMKLYPSRSTSSLSVSPRFNWKQLEMDFTGTPEDMLLKYEVLVKI